MSQGTRNGHVIFVSCVHLNTRKNGTKTEEKRLKICNVFFGGCAFRTNNLNPDLNGSRWGTAYSATFRSFFQTPKIDLIYSPETELFESTCELFIHRFSQRLRQSFAVIPGQRNLFFLISRKLWPSRKCQFLDQNNIGQSRECPEVVPTGYSKNLNPESSIQPKESIPCMCSFASGYSLFRWTRTTSVENHPKTLLQKAKTSCENGKY